MKRFLLTAAVLCTMLQACAAGRPVKYYRIDVPAPLQATAPAPGAGFGVSIEVANIDAPPLMRDGRILYQVGAHEIGAYQYHRWVETPDRMVQNALVRMLRSSGKYQSIDTPNGGKTDYVMRGKIYEFNEVDKPAVFTRVSMEIELHDAKSNRMVWSHVYRGEEMVEGKEIPDVVHSLDQNMRRGLSEVVAGLDQYFAGL
jgi:ABC-type uncharacterized transport system auxiliary subunit